jgi:hypothetical protein
MWLRWFAAGRFSLPFALCFGTVMTFSSCQGSDTGALAKAGFLQVAIGGRLPVVVQPAVPRDGTYVAEGDPQPTASVATITADPVIWSVPALAVVGLLTAWRSRWRIRGAVALTALAVIGVLVSILAQVGGPSTASRGPTTQPLQPQTYGIAGRFAPGFVLALLSIIPLVFVRIARRR